MADLNFVGEEPSWEMMDLVDRVDERDPGAGVGGERAEEQKAKQELERLVQKRRILAAEL